MKKGCCNIKETGTEKDYNPENTCCDVNEICKTIFENCCSGEKKEDSGKSCC